jgi:hypothetical protein
MKMILGFLGVSKAYTCIQERHRKAMAKDFIMIFLNG